MTDLGLCTQVNMTDLDLCTQVNMTDLDLCTEVNMTDIDLCTQVNLTDLDPCTQHIVNLSWATLITNDVSSTEQAKFVLLENGLKGVYGVVYVHTFMHM